MPLVQNMIFQKIKRIYKVVKRTTLYIEHTALYIEHTTLYIEQTTLYIEHTTLYIDNNPFQVDREIFPSYCIEPEEITFLYQIEQLCESRRSKYLNKNNSKTNSAVYFLDIIFLYMFVLRIFYFSQWSVLQEAYIDVTV